METQNDVTEWQRDADKKLTSEAEAIAAASGSAVNVLIRRRMSRPVAERLSAFVFQDDTGELARAVLKPGRTLTGCLDACLEGVGRDNPVLSDIDAYTRALRYYLPEGSVRCSFRVVVPQEVDEDLLFLDSTDTQKTGKTAVVLDFFVGGDSSDCSGGDSSDFSGGDGT